MAQTAGKIRADGDAFAVGKFLPDDACKVEPERVAVYHLYIIKFRQRFAEYRNEPVVQLDSHHPFGAAGKLRRQHADSRTDFQHAGLFVCTAHLRHSRADRGIDKEILPQSLGEGKAVSLHDVLDSAYI